VAAILQPAKKLVKLFGKIQVKNILDFFAFITVNSSISSLSVLLSPSKKLTSIGKIQTITTIMIFGIMPKPNQIRISGAIAIRGTVWDISKKG